MRHGPFRLPNGGLVDRSRSIPFTFNGKTLTGLQGDTLASALLAHRTRIIGRSFKFHRPRGVFSAGVEEPHALVQLGCGARAVPSARATLTPLHEGLAAYTQSGWPSARFDLLGLLDLIAPVFAAGFYNKTFIWPSWHAYEPIIRSLAGLGRAPLEPDPDRYDVHNTHCDVLIVGAGVAGLRAALAEAGARRRVILVDYDTDPGGSARWDGSSVDGEPAAGWIRRSCDALLRLPNFKLMCRTAAVGSYDHRVMALLQQAPVGSAARERYWIVRVGKVVLATGAIEQPLVFCNNDRPGIMLAGAARRYLACQAIAPGRRIVIATNNDSAYALAEELHRAGVPPMAVLDSRPQAPATGLLELAALGIETHTASMPLDTSGWSALSSVTFGNIGAGGAVQRTDRLECDALLVSGGWNPSLSLFAQAGGKLTFGERSRSLEPANRVEGFELAGSAAGQSDASAVGPRISGIGNTARQWVDLLHDVTVSDIELAIRENYSAMEHIKRYTTVGMAADQGKTSSPLSLEVAAHCLGCSPSQLGHTTLRPPFMPVTLGAIAGRALGDRFAPCRLLTLHEWHLAHGAVMQEFGEWRRPVVYARAGESRDQATRREARSVRTTAGLFDGSSLGKLEIHGPDALEFLDRFYINDLTTLKPGRVRYGLMLRETGSIFDDGTIVGMAPDRLLITTTSGNAERVRHWLEEWHQCEWPHLRVAVQTVTEQWSTFSLTGPRARNILARLPTDIDLAPEAFPHLAMRSGTLSGVPTRIYRVSFTGELTYEINVPTSQAAMIWEALLQAGATDGLMPFGLDALMLLRLEKGFLHVGSDTDGSTIPDDVGWGRVAASKRRDYIGKRSLTLPANVSPDRLHLVGIRGIAGSSFVVGSHARLGGSIQATDGWITSAGVAVLADEPIALALLRGGRANIGATVSLYDSGGVIGSGRLVSPPFFDPSGHRMAS